MSDIKTRVGTLTTVELYGSGKAVKSNKKHTKHVAATMRRKGQLSEREAIRAFSLGMDSSSSDDDDSEPSKVASEYDNPDDPIQRIVPSFGSGAGPIKKTSKWTLKRHKRTASQPPPPSLLAGFASEVADKAVTKNPTLQPQPLSTKKHPNLSRRSRSNSKLDPKNIPITDSTSPSLSKPKSQSSISSLTPKQILARENAKKNKKKRSFTFGRRKSKNLEVELNDTSKSLDDIVVDAKLLHSNRDMNDLHSPSKSSKSTPHRKLSSSEKKKIKMDQATSIMIEQFDQQVKKNAQIKKSVRRNSSHPGKGHQKRPSLFNRMFRKSAPEQVLAEHSENARKLYADKNDGSGTDSTSDSPNSHIKPQLPLPVSDSNTTSPANKHRTPSTVEIVLSPTSPRFKDLSQHLDSENFDSQPQTQTKSLTHSTKPADTGADKNVTKLTNNDKPLSPKTQNKPLINSSTPASKDTNSNAAIANGDQDFADMLDALDMNVTSPLLNPKARKSTDSKNLLESLEFGDGDLESMLSDLESSMSQNEDPLNDSLNVSLRLDDLLSAENSGISEPPLNSDLHDDPSQNLEKQYDFDNMTDDELLLAMLDDNDNDSLLSSASDPSSNPPPKSSIHKLPSRDSITDSLSPTGRASPIPRNLPALGSAARSLSSNNLVDLEDEYSEDYRDINHYYSRFLKEKGTGFWERPDLEPPRIEIFEKVGKGATASVWRGEMIPDGGRGEPIPVAVKTMSLFGVKDRKGTRRILRTEVDMMKDFQHPAVVQYFGMWYDKTTKEANIVMELVSGGTVQEPLDALGKFPEAICATVLMQVLEALAFLHSQGIIHRDLKPDNMLISPEFGNIKITDFGTATQIVELQAKHRSTVGTAWYLSPEVVNAQPYTFPADIWSIGSCFLAMITGHPPFGDLDAVDCIFKISSEIPPIPTDISPEAQDFLSKCWKHNPAERASAEELLAHPFMDKCNQVNSQQYRDFICSAMGTGSVSN